MEKNGPDFGSHLQSVWPEAAVNANGLLLACGLLDIIVCMIIIKYGFGRLANTDAVIILPPNPGGLEMR
jgi:hypothetical protein